MDDNLHIVIERNAIMRGSGIVSLVRVCDDRAPNWVAEIISQDGRVLLSFPAGCYPSAEATQHRIGVLSAAVEEWKALLAGQVEEDNV